MRVNDRRRKNSLRQPGHDYRRTGTVFITIDTWGRQKLFGEIIDGTLHTTPGGQMVIERWQDIPREYPQVTLDTFVVMPDHLHGILTTVAGPPGILPSIGEVVRWFKAATPASWRFGIAKHGWPPYDGRLWQPDYYDRVARDDDELARIRRYIEANPSRWLAE